MKKRSVAAAAMAASMLFVACSDDKDASTTTAAAETTMAAEGAEAGDIVAVASANPDFSTLVAAVGAAGLVETLQGAGPFTVFAPTNAAFAALPLANVALTHVFRGAEGPALIKVLGRTGQVQLVYGVLLAVGLAIGLV